jgi:hypothetical protein
MCVAYVRFGAHSGSMSDIGSCPRCASNGTHAVQQTRRIKQLIRSPRRLQTEAIRESLNPGFVPLRLIDKSNLLGNIIGKSAGFPPRKIRAT